MSDVSWDISSARQNLTPNEVDRASIQHAIAEAQLRLTTQQESEADAQELRSRVAVLSSLLAPIRRLPPKILVSIFLHPVLHTSISRGSTAARFGGRGLDPISAVSFHWRATALSTPEFWALFTITLPGNDNVARLLELYLERSKPCTLSIEIRAPYPGTAHPGVLQQLLDSCRRWTTLHLSVDSSQLSLFSPVRGHLQSLENFDLHVSRIGTREDLMEVVAADAFELAPKLSRLKLSMADNVVPALPLNQITTLTVSSWKSLPFASECPNLLILSISQDLEATLPPRVTVTAPKILTIPSMLENLTAPNLEFLHIVAGRPLWTHAWFSSFIQRSACHPHTLHLDEVVMTASDLLAVLPLIPTVHSLILRSLRPNAITDKLLAGLTVTESSSSPPLLPALTNLSVTGSYLFSNTALLEMLESRVNFQQSIQRVKLQLTHRQFSEVELDRARPLRRDAVLFSLKCLDADKQYTRII